MLPWERRQISVIWSKYLLYIYYELIRHSRDEPNQWVADRAAAQALTELAEGLNFKVMPLWLKVPAWHRLILPWRKVQVFLLEGFEVHRSLELLYSYFYCILFLQIYRGCLFFYRPSFYCDDSLWVPAVQEAQLLPVIAVLHGSAWQCVSSNVRLLFGCLMEYLSIAEIIPWSQSKWCCQKSLLLVCLVPRSQQLE